MRKTILLTVMLSLVASCKKDEAAKPGDKAAGKDGDKKGGTPAAKVESKFMPVPKLGVQIEVPSNAELMETNETAVMISASAPECTVLLSKTNPDMAEKYESAVKDAEKGLMGKFKAFTKNEQTPDGGWKLEWTYTSDMDPKNPEDMWGVSYRVVIDGALYDCARNTDKADAAACIAKACGSLKKL